MNVAILGGRFDPPHLGHFLLAQQTLEIKTDVEKVLLVPSYKHPWRDIVASAEDRIKMLKSSLDSRMEVNTTDIDNKEQFTFNTLTRLRKKYSKIYWIIGSDIVAEFAKWKNYEKLPDLATFLVFPRDPHLLPNNLPKGFELMDPTKTLNTNISSTLIRNKIKERKSIKYLVPEKIERYIKEHRLYE